MANAAAAPRPSADPVRGALADPDLFPRRRTRRRPAASGSTAAMPLAVTDPADGEPSSAASRR